MPPVAEGHALPADVVDEILRAGLRVIVLAAFVVAINLHPPRLLLRTKKDAIAGVPRRDVEMMHELSHTVSMSFIIAYFFRSNVARLSRKSVASKRVGTVKHLADAADEDLAVAVDRRAVAM